MNMWWQMISTIDLKPQTKNINNCMHICVYLGFYCKYRIYFYILQILN